MITKGIPGSECGIRFGKKKYMDVTKPDSNPGEKYFKGSKRGAVLMKLNKIAIFVIWDEEKGHVPAKVTQQVGSVADYLRSKDL